MRRAECHRDVHSIEAAASATQPELSSRHYCAPKMTSKSMPRAAYFSVRKGSDPDDHLPVPRSRRILWPGYSAGSIADGTAIGSMYAACSRR